MFILHRDWGHIDDLQAVTKAHKEYEDYLKSNKKKFPKSAYEFAIAEWHHDFSDHKALHDSWLEECLVKEIYKTGKRNEPKTQIILKLLGAYHDGYIVLTYSDVKSYKLGAPNVDSGHSDLYRDEVRLSESGNVLHEIEWLGVDDTWTIECGDIHFEWLPRENV